MMLPTPTSYTKVDDTFGWFRYGTTQDRVSLVVTVKDGDVIDCYADGATFYAGITRYPKGI